MISRHLVKSETAHTRTNLKQSEGLAGADCCSHYSGLSDSLPCSPRLSTLYKDQAYGAGSKPPSHILSHRTPIAPRPSSDSLGTIWILFFAITMDLDTLFKSNFYLEG